MSWHGRVLIVAILRRKQPDLAPRPGRQGHVDQGEKASATSPGSPIGRGARFRAGRLSVRIRCGVRDIWAWVPEAKATVLRKLMNLKVNLPAQSAFCGRSHVHHLENELAGEPGPAANRYGAQALGIVRSVLRSWTMNPAGTGHRLEAGRAAQPLGIVRSVVRVVAAYAGEGGDTSWKLNQPGLAPVRSGMGARALGIVASNFRSGTLRAMTTPQFDLAGHLSRSAHRKSRRSLPTRGSGQPRTTSSGPSRSGHGGRRTCCGVNWIGPAYSLAIHEPDSRRGGVPRLPGVGQHDRDGLP